MKIERRFVPNVGAKLETRADGSRVITGYGAVFFNQALPGTEYELYPGCMERIDPKAFDRCLAANADVRGLFNHDANMVLGRTSAGTMECRTDPQGLAYEITPPDTQAAKDVCQLLERGDVTGSSFSFSVRKQARAQLPNGTVIRTLEDVELIDVGPVTFPAYDGTSVGMRAAGDLSALKAEITQWQAEQTAGLEYIARRKAELAAREASL